MPIIKPVQCFYDGKVFTPANKFQAKRATEQYGEGEFIGLVPLQERSDVSHNHYFATLNDLWLNLPERYDMEPWAQTSEALRKYALIKEGFYDSDTFPCASKAEAQRWAKYLRPIDEYSIVIVDGTVVTRFMAKSQSYKGMPGKGNFQRSKNAVLGFVENLIDPEGKSRHIHSPEER